MRSGQSKRMRGRSNNNNNNRKGPNPLTRSYESNGPDVKIRGTAHHIGEKYLQLARDAQSSGDPVMAESYLQHAEHYFRIIATAQQAQQQSYGGFQQRQGAEQLDEEDGDDDFASLPDRFASPSERAPQPQVQPPPYQERPAYAQNDRQPYEQRADRQPQPYQDRQANDRPSGERQEGRQPYDNRNGRSDRNNYQDRGQDRGPDRNYEQRGQDRGYQDRGGYDRNGPDRNNQDRNNQDRNGQDRGSQDRGYQDRGNQDRGGQDRNYQDRGTRDYENKGGYRGRGRDYRDNNPPRDQSDPRQPAADEPSNGLPAFITSPSRPQTEIVPEPEARAEDQTPQDGNEAGNDGASTRSRRRRRPKYEHSDDAESSQAAPAETSAVGD